MTEIRFGTDGWQDKMGRDFTFANVRLAAQAFANLLRRAHSGRETAVMLNYDSRYLSETYAQKAAQILALNKVNVYFPLRDAPTPAMALAIVKKQMRGGMHFTCGRPEPSYNGIKLFTASGAPALPSRTLLLENEIKKTAAHFTFKHQYPDANLIHFIDIRPAYLEHIAATVRLDLIKRSRQTIIVDNLFGTSRDYLDRLFNDHGVEITAIHNYSDSYFGGEIPSCTQVHLRELARLVTSKGADIGLATDLSSERFGIIDPHGRFIAANLIMPPLIEYLVTVRKMSGDIVKSVSSTEQITRVAEHYQLKVHETPVGFKFLADTLSSRNAFIGVEGGNGAALHGPAPCRDGILFSLLVCEMLAHAQMQLPQLLNRFARRFPPLFARETHVAGSVKRREKFLSLLQQKNFSFPGLDLKKIRYIDGIKFIFTDSWLLLRESGTSDAIRLCAEAPRLRQAQQLLLAGRKLLE